MKHLILLSIFSCLSLTAVAQKDPVVMSIDGKPVTQTEFLQIYTKNNPNPSFDKDSLDRYMELFQVFKLKVAEAEALGYDTLPRLKKELEGYKKQLALPYLIDSVQNQNMVTEAYNRTATEVRCSHILIKLDPNASPKDTLAAYNRLLGLKARIEKGEDFASVAKSKNGSEDPSVVNNGGDLGYFTAFQMVYPFEEKAYNTPVGQVSDPFRTRFGYHILKVTDKRPARGTIRVAHIMIATGREATQETRMNAEKKINEIYDSLVAGAAWDKMVSAYSEDANSTKKAGELPAFGSGTSQRMVLEFEDAAFALKEVGQISKPVKTQYGYHIIKLTEIAGKDQGYDALKPQIRAELMYQKALAKFSEEAENFSSTVYEQSTSLKPAADAFHVPVQKTEWLSYADGAKFFKSVKLMSLVFTDEVLKDKRNTEAVEVSNNTLVAARVVEHKPSAPRSFDEVKAGIEDLLKIEKAAKMAMEKGASALASLKSGKEAAGLDRILLS